MLKPHPLILSCPRAHKNQSDYFASSPFSSIFFSTLLHSIRIDVRALRGDQHGLITSSVLDEVREQSRAFVLALFPLSFAIQLQSVSIMGWD